MVLVCTYGLNVFCAGKKFDSRDNTIYKLRTFPHSQFVAHPHIQQLLASLWYDGLPGFRRKSPLLKAWEIVKIALLFPYYCALYMIFPGSSTGKLMKKPFMKFLIHSSSYLFFLCEYSQYVLFARMAHMLSSLSFKANSRNKAKSPRCPTLLTKL